MKGQRKRSKQFKFLYTPLRDTFLYNHQNAIAFIGIKDAWSDYKVIVALSQKADIQIKVYPGCNHSLEMDDDVEGNIHYSKFHECSCIGEA